jgi:hypothetical protein
MSGSPVSVRRGGATVLVVKRDGHHVPATGSEVSAWREEASTTGAYRPCVRPAVRSRPTAIAHRTLCGRDGGAPPPGGSYPARRAREPGPPRPRVGPAGCRDRGCTGRRRSARPGLTPGLSRPEGRRPGTFRVTLIRWIHLHLRSRRHKETRGSTHRSDGLSLYAQEPARASHQRPRDQGQSPTHPLAFIDAGRSACWRVLSRRSPYTSSEASGARAPLPTAGATSPYRTSRRA